MAEDNKEVWSDWIEIGKSTLYESIPEDIRGDWEWRNVEYRMDTGKILEGQLYPDEVPFAYTDSDGNVVEDATKEYFFIDENTDPIAADRVVAWRYQKE